MKKRCALILAIVAGFTPAYLAAQTYSLTGNRVGYSDIRDTLAGYDAIRVSANGQLYVNQSTTLAHNFFLSGSRGGNSLNAPSSQEAGSLRTDGQVTLTGNITLEGDTGISVYGNGGNGYFTGSFIDTTGYKLAILKPNVVATMHLQGDNSAFAGHWYLYDTVRVSTNNTSATPAAGGGDQRFGLNTVNMQGGVLVAAANDAQLHSDVNLIAGSYGSGYSGAIETPTGMPMHLRGDISGSGTLQKTGAGVLNLYGNVADSTLAVNMGTLALQGSGTLNPAAITVGANGKLQLAGTVATTIDERFQLQAGTLQLTSGEVNVTSSREVGKLILDAGANAATSGPGALVTASLRMGNNLFSSSGGNMTVTGSDMAAAPTLTMKGGTLTPAVLYTSDTLPDFFSGNGTPKLHVQFDASSAGNFTLENGNEITAWKDTSGSGNDGAKATTGTPSSPITLTSNGLNGMPTVKFSSDGRSGFNFTRSTDVRSVFWVLKDGVTTSGADNSFLMGDSSAYHFHRNGTALWGGAHANILNGRTLVNGVHYAGATGTLDYNWNLVSLQTTGGVAASSLSIDRNGNNNPSHGMSLRSWDGEMAEVLIYTGAALTDAQADMVNYYLNEKWGLGLNLAPIADVTATAFSAPGVTVAVEENSVLDVSGFSTVELGNIAVSGGKWLEMKMDAGTRWATDLDLGVGGIAVLNGDRTLAMTGDLRGAGEIVGNLALDGGVYFNLSDPDFDLLFVTGELDFSDLEIYLTLDLDDTSLLDTPIQLFKAGIYSGFSDLDDIIFHVPPSLLASASMDGQGGMLVTLNNNSSSAVPEPATWLLMLFGGLGIALQRRREQR